MTANDAGREMSCYARFTRNQLQKYAEYELAAAAAIAAYKTGRRVGVGTPKFSIGHWPPPRATVVMSLYGDRIYGTEFSVEEAKVLHALLTERIRGASGDEDWWGARPTEPDPATLERLARGLDAALVPHKLWFDVPILKELALAAWRAEHEKPE